jgi:hypothetical protein
VTPQTSLCAQLSGTTASRRRTSAMCAVLLCASGLWADAAQARPPRVPKAASTPSTAQILAPSTATVPDALLPTQRIYRCGNAYSPQACADAKPLDIADARTDAQRRQSEEVAGRDKRLARWMEANRRERDTVASAPARLRVTEASRDCVETDAITCKPKKPRPRHAVSKAASGGAR